MDGYTRVTRVFDSSQITEVSYDLKRKKLWVEFENKSAYTYEGVDPETYSRLVGATSVGKFFASYVRPFFKGVKVSV